MMEGIHIQLKTLKSKLLQIQATHQKQREWLEVLKQENTELKEKIKKLRAKSSEGEKKVVLKTILTQITHQKEEKEARKKINFYKDLIDQCIQLLEEKFP